MDGLPVGEWEVLAEVDGYGRGVLRVRVDDSPVKGLIVRVAPP